MHSDRSSEREGDFPEVTQQDSSRAGLGSWALGVLVPSLNSQGTLRGRQGPRNPWLGHSQPGVSGSPSIPINFPASEWVVFLSGTISAFGDSRVPGLGTLRGPWAQNVDYVLPAHKRTVLPGKPMGTRSWQCGWESRVTREPGLSLGILEGTQGTVPWGAEHWPGFSLPLTSILVFTHPLHVQKTLTSTSSILILS